MTGVEAHDDPQRRSPPAGGAGVPLSGLPPQGRRRPWGAWAALLAGVLAAHAALLGAVDAAAEAPSAAREAARRSVELAMATPVRDASEPAPQLQQREAAAPVTAGDVEPSPAVDRAADRAPFAAATDPAGFGAAPGVEPRKAARATRRVARVEPSFVIDTPIRETVTPIVAPAAAPPVRIAAADAAASTDTPSPTPTPAPAPASTAAPASAPEPTPVYPTKLPPAFDYTYDLSRGMLRGSGAIKLSFTADGYEARLEGSAIGIHLIDWVSRGALDAAGFAPQRFTEQRMRKAAQAANFQRQAGKISYSGYPDEFALPEGAQDRLSWMLQLAAITQARPERVSAGERVAMFVSGVRADADVWAFKMVGRETIDLPIGRIEGALHMLREPRNDHDTRAEVWLDPARHYLPVRARLSNTPDGSDAFELALREASSHAP